MAKKKLKSEVLYGINPVTEALKAGKRSFGNVLVTKKENPSPRILEILERSEALKITVQELPESRLTALAGTDSHQGVCAEVDAFPTVGTDNILQHQGSGPPFVLFLDSIVDPHNLGALIRTALCSGVHGIIIPKDRSASPTPSVSKASAGALEHARIAVVTNLAKTISDMKKEGLWIAGLDAAGDQSIFESNLSGPLGIVIGGEDKGVRPLVQKQCDFMISIPQKGVFNSLNASVAGAIAMYEAFRQRSE